MRSRLKAAKYFAIIRIGVGNAWAYILDQLFDTLLVIVVMFVFIQLWRTTYGHMGVSEAVGYTLPALILYLSVTEGLGLARTRVGQVVSDEIVSGDIVYRLMRPVSYIGYHTANTLGEVLPKLGLNLVVSIGLSWLLVGNLPVDYRGIPLFMVAVVLGVTLRLAMTLLVASIAFWVEENWAFLFAYERLVLFLGGMIIPLDFFPQWLQPVLNVLPFRLMFYSPARLLLEFHPTAALHLVGQQLFWLAIILTATRQVLRIGGRQLYVNGG